MITALLEEPGKSQYGSRSASATRSKFRSQRAKNPLTRATTIYTVEEEAEQHHARNISKPGERSTRSASEGVAAGPDRTRPGDGERADAAEAAAAPAPPDLCRCGGAARLHPQGGRRAQRRGLGVESPDPGSRIGFGCGAL